MARLHVLETNGVPNLYRVILHEATPAGNNSAGLSWSSVMVGAGIAKTRMTEGTGPGQITTAEKNSVEAGTTIEGEFWFQDNPSDNAAARNAALDAHATRYLAELQADIARKYKFFGATRT